MTLRDVILLIDSKQIESDTEAKGVYRLTSVEVCDNVTGRKVYTDTHGGLTYNCMGRLREFVLKQIAVNYLNDTQTDDYYVEVMGLDSELLPVGKSWQEYRGVAPSPEENKNE